MPPALVHRRPSPRAIGGGGRHRNPARPRARHSPPRPEAVQYPARRGRLAARDRLRPGQAVRRRQQPDAVRCDRGDAELHGARAGLGSQRGDLGADRRLRPGGRALRPVDRPASIRRGHDLRGRSSKREWPLASPGADQPPRRPRPGDDLPSVPGEGPLAALRLGRGAGRRPPALARRRADRGATSRRGGRGLDVVAPQLGRDRPARGR